MRISFFFDDRNQIQNERKFKGRCGKTEMKHAGID